MTTGMLLFGLSIALCAILISAINSTRMDKPTDVK